MKRKYKAWLLSNGAILALFVIGNQYGIGWVKTLGEIGMWIAAIAGIVVGIGLMIWNQLKDKIDFKPYVLVDELADKLPPKCDRNDSIGIFPVKDLMRLAHGSIPWQIDMTYDLGVVAIMVYYGYEYLPIFYVLHILGYMQMHWQAKRFLENGPRLETEEDLEIIKNTTGEEGEENEEDEKN